MSEENNIVSSEIDDIPDEIWFAGKEYNQVEDTYGEGTPFQNDDDVDYIKSL